MEKELTYEKDVRELEKIWQNPNTSGKEKERFLNFSVNENHTESLIKMHT